MEKEVEIMAQTYCGNSCESCTKKEKLQCPGCRVGPGRRYGAECAIAKCSITKGLHCCEDCQTANNCFTLKNRSGAADTRQRTQDKEDRTIRRRYDASSLLDRWLMISFWLTIVSLSVNVILTLTGLTTSVETLADISGIVFSFLQALILLRLTSASYCFKLSGILGLVNVGISVIQIFIDHKLLLLAVVLGALIVSFVSEYQQFLGYMEVTEEFESDLSEKWSKLWSVHFVCLCAVGVGAILTIIGLSLAALVVLLGTIGSVVTSILKIVYLYRSAVFFREYFAEIRYYF